MASLTLLPLEILLNIRDHLAKPSDILTYESPRDENGNLNLSDNHPIKETLSKLQMTLQHKSSFQSSIKILHIHLHTGVTSMTAGEEIYTLLPHLHHLKYFRLITEVLNYQALSLAGDNEAPSPARDKTSPARLAIALKDSTCKTLEILELALGRDRSHTDGTALGDLNSFIALKKISVQSYVLLGGYGIEGYDRNYSSRTEPMISEILPANLLHLRIHCGGAEAHNGNNCVNHKRRDRDGAVAHLAAPANWGPKEPGSCEGPIRPEEVVRANRLRVLKSVRKCYCPTYGDFWAMIRELVRLFDRLDIVGEDYVPRDGDPIA